MCNNTDHGYGGRLVTPVSRNFTRSDALKEDDIVPDAPRVVSPHSLSDTLEGLHPEAELALTQSVDDLTVIQAATPLPETEEVDTDALREILQPSRWRARRRDAIFVLGERLPPSVRCEPAFHSLSPRALPAVLEIIDEQRWSRRLTIAVPHTMNRESAGHLKRAEKLGALVLPLSTVIEQRCPQVSLDESLELAPPSLGRRVAIRLFDLAFGLVGSLLVLMILAPVALAIWLEDRGPIFYAQTRVGRARRVFRLIKFRSMRPDAEKSGPKWASSNDDRLTRTGSVLRRFHVDELPQFFNVLLGHMSIVGPRPERPIFERVLRDSLPFYEYRHTVRPGLTGWGTVKVGYSNSIAAKRLALQYDLYYVANASLAFDMAIVARTARHLVVRPEMRNRFMI